MLVRPTENLICPQKTFVALGTFDGLHQGHRAVINTALTDSSLVPTVFSVIPAQRNDALLLPEEQQALLSHAGVELFVPAPLSDIRHLTPESFFEEIVIRKLNAAKLVCGFNFRFGKNAAGDTRLLQSLCDRNGIHLTVLPAVKEGEQPVSSSRIRVALKQGDVALANRLLGRRFGFCLPVIEGQHLGKKLGFPTMNQALPKELLCPRLGVYAVLVTAQNKQYAGVCNIGSHPTVGALSRPLAETHIIGFEGNLYRQNVDIRLIDFLREEQTFSSLAALQNAIEKNVEQAKAIVKL